MALYILCFILLVEYLGLGYHFVPILKKVPLPLSGLVFLSLVTGARIKEVVKYTPAKMFIIICVYATLSILWATVSSYVIDEIKVLIGYTILLLSLACLMDSEKKIKLIMLTMVVVNAANVLLNIDTLLNAMHQGVRSGVIKAGYFVSDGNDLAWSLVTFFPMCLYFVFNDSSKIKKIISAGSGFLIIIGVITTSSRGASIALIVSIVYAIIKSKKKHIAISAVILILPIVLIVTPAFYLTRMETITDYETDSSVMGRLTAWKAATMMAIDWPLGVGAGNFNTAYGRFYRDKLDRSKMAASQRWISPHSIYFLIIGEYGFIGLILLLKLLYSNFRTNSVVINIKDLKKPQSTDMREMGKYLSMCLIAYAIGGMFLGGLDYPHIYILTSIIIALNIFYLQLIKQDNEEKGRSC